MKNADLIGTSTLALKKQRSKAMRIIFEYKEYRIVEHADECSDIKSLKGDSYNPSVITDIPTDQLQKEERDFERLVNTNGVFGYILERWNPSVGKGWEHVDSCWGFVGAYDSKVEDFTHYIVEELKQQIKVSYAPNTTHRPTTP